MTQSWDPGYGQVPPPPPRVEPPSPAASGSGQGRGVVIAGVLTGVVLISGGVGFAIGRATAGGGGEDAATAAAVTTTGPSRLQVAFDACSKDDDGDTLAIADEGRTIVVDTGSEYGDFAPTDCVLSELGTPESIRAEIGRTTSMMGVQDGEHDGISYSWSYHPDNGVDMVITDEGPTA